MKGDAILRIDKLSKRFGGLWAIRDVSFDVPKGRVKALIGPNGAGKTTLFNLVTGLDEATYGNILFMGQKLGGMKTYQRAALGLSRTFQIPQVFRNMTVLENVLVGRHLHGRSGLLDGLLSTPRSRREDRMMREFSLGLLEKVGLSDKADEEAGNLAYGEIKFLEIARALASQPNVLLLDECAAGLTAQESDEIGTLLSGLRDEGMTIFLVEHDMRMVMSLSDEIVVLNFGEKIAEGQPKEIREDFKVIEVYLGTEE